MANQLSVVQATNMAVAIVKLWDVQQVIASFFRLANQEFTDWKADKLLWNGYRSNSEGTDNLDKDMGRKGTRCIEICYGNSNGSNI